MLDADTMIKLLWRLPVWAPLTRSIEKVGGSYVPRNVAPPLGVVRDPAPLDAFQASCCAGLVAGAASCDITPERPSEVLLGGFGNNRPCTGVRDPIMARALVLSDGTTPLVIVTVDLIGLSLVRTRRIRDMLTRRHRESVLVVSTHNHQSPDTLGLWGNALGGLVPYRTGLNHDYMAWLERRIVACVEQAMAAAQPARLHFSEGEFDSEQRWVHNERSNVIDRTLRAMLLTDEQGATIATLLQHACHPETLWKENGLISADYCGVCCNYVEQHVGGVCLYANGALGAMVTQALPWEAPMPDREPFVGDQGEALGAAGVNLVKEARGEPVSDTTIGVASSPVRFPARDNRLFALVHALGVVERRDIENGLLSQVTHARIGPATITTLPGEPAPELGRDMLTRVGGSPKFLFGLGNDELGYLLPKAAFSDKVYVYETTMSPGEGAARLLGTAVDRAVRDVQAARR